MKIRLFFILITLFFGGCVGNAPQTPKNTSNETGALTVSAAVSLKDAFKEIAALYETQTGRSISFNFGASGALQKQIETGAPVDVFASAGVPQMDELAGKNLIDAATRRDFASNTLVLIVPANSKTQSLTFADLTKPEITKIAVGNPKTVPAGVYSEQVFEKLNLKSALQTKLILAEDVRQVLDYVARGETDAGLVYASDARSAGDKIRVAANAPEGSHAPISYPIAVVTDSERKDSAREFIDFILSAEGQKILRKHGFK